MSHPSRLLLAALATSALLAGSVAAQSEGGDAPLADPLADPRAHPALPQSAPVAQASGVALASDIVGENVTSPTDPDEGIGKVEELVACADGKLLVVIEREDGTLAGVPFDRFIARVQVDDDADDGASKTAEVTALTFRGDMTMLATAPPLDELERLDAAWVRRVSEQFSDDAPSTRSTPGDETGAPGGTGSSDTTGKAGTTGASTSPAAQEARAPVRMDELVGKDVTSRAGKDLADVKDVAVDLARGQVAYVVIRSGGVLGVGDRVHGVALESLVPSGKDGKLVLDVDEATLENTPGLDLKHLPSRPNLMVPAKVSLGSTGDRPTEPRR